MKLEERMSVTGDRLVVSYRLENPTAADMFVLDAPYTMEGDRPVVRDARVYTQIEGDLLQLVRASLAIPQWVQVEAPEVPYARRLPAHASLEGRIDAPLPLAYDNPYDFSDGPKVMRCHRVQLVVGYAAAPDLAEAPTKLARDGAELYRIPYRAVSAAQKLVASPVHSLPITVQRQP